MTVDQISAENTPISEIREGIRLYCEPGHTYEVRSPKAGRHKTISGYFTDFEMMGDAAHHLSDGIKVPAVYSTINPVKPDLLARAANATKNWAEVTTSDKEVVRLLRLLIDLDPVRPSGISASDEEHQLALEMGQEVRTGLTAKGWPMPGYVDSGNGAHLVYRIDLENTPENVKLLEAVLKALHAVYSTDRVKVDTTTFNPARISKLPGTMARKGDHITERPHRRSRILERPEVLEAVPVELLRELAGIEPPEPTVGAFDRAYAEVLQAEALGQAEPMPDWFEEPAAAKGGAWTRERLEKWLADHGVTHQEPVEDGSRLKYRLDHCVFDPSHEGRDAAVFLTVEGDEAGLIGYKCFHDSCSDKHWKEVREKLDPAADRKPADQGDTSWIDDLYAQAGGDGGSTPNAGDQFPEIVINGRQMREVTADALAAIHRANTPPRYFVRGSAPVRIDRDEEAIKFAPLTQDMMRGTIARAADWYQVSVKDGKATKTPKHPPDNVVKDLLSLPPSEWRFPHVDTIVKYPVFTEAGLMRPGYDRTSRCWCEPNIKVVLPDRVTGEDVRRAVAFINDNVFRDFPFVSAGDRANCWAALLLWYVRSLIDGPTPLHIIDAPVEGTGKGKLLSCLVYIATGAWPSSFKEAHGDDEWRKMLTTALLEGPDYIFIDNINYALNSGAFAGILTDREHSDRILGGNRRVSLAVKNLWFATGNNVRGSKEIVRRSVRIRLDAKCETPSNRTGWKHNLDTWVPQNRAALLNACLTICKGWFDAGRPRSTATMGSYENWAGVMGGILQFAGIPGFLDNRKQMLEDMNNADDEWPYLISQWNEVFNTTPVKPAMLMQLAVSDGILSACYSGSTERGVQTSWGNALNRQVDRVFSGMQVQTAGKDRKGTRLYKLVPLAAGE